MTIDATFWVAVSFVIFVGLILYFRIPEKVRSVLDDNINNITTFKLFIPEAREGGENEIFVSSFLRELGFLAPRTFMISSKINGASHKYIFQEDLRKEFLENAHLVEGPLLEGDERLTVDRIKDNKMIPSLSLSRIINKNLLHFIKHFGL